MPKPMRTRPVSAAPTPARHKNSPTLRSASLQPAASSLQAAWLYTRESTPPPRYAALESVNEPPEKTMHKFWSSWVKLAAMALRSSANFDVCCR